MGKRLRTPHNIVGDTSCGHRDEGKSTEIHGNPRNRPYPAVSGTIDFLPTRAELSGAEIPRDRYIDGKDIWPLMTGEPGAKTGRA